MRVSDRIATGHMTTSLKEIKCHVSEDVRNYLRVKALEGDPAFGSSDLRNIKSNLIGFYSWESEW
jgi:hypothetical protein